MDLWWNETQWFLWFVVRMLCFGIYGWVRAGASGGLTTKLKFCPSEFLIIVLKPFQSLNDFTIIHAKNKIPAIASAVIDDYL